MARGKGCYWDEIKDNEETFVIEGWECHLKLLETTKWNARTQSNKIEMNWVWPFEEDDGVDGSLKTIVKQIGKILREKRMVLSKASHTKEEYLDLLDRVRDVSWEEIMGTKLSGKELNAFIKSKYLSTQEIINFELGV